MPVYISGSGGETVYGSGSMSASAGDSTLSSRLITADKLIFRSNLGIALGGSATKLSIAGRVVATGSVESSTQVSGNVLTGRYSGSYSTFERIDAARPLLSLESGHTFLLSKNNKVMTLPSPDQAGIYYKFIARQNFNTNNSGVRSAAGADYIYGTAVASDGGNVSSSYTPSNNFCSFTTGSKVGDSFEIISQGSAWYVTGQCHSGSTAPSSNAAAGKLAGITFHK